MHISPGSANYRINKISRAFPTRIQKCTTMFKRKELSTVLKMGNTESRMLTGCPISIFDFVFVFPALTFRALASFFFLTKLGSKLGSDVFMTKHDGATHDIVAEGSAQACTCQCRMRQTAKSSHNLISKKVITQRIRVLSRSISTV